MEDRNRHDQFEEDLPRPELRLGREPAPVVLRGRDSGEDPPLAGHPFRLEHIEFASEPKEPGIARPRPFREAPDPREALLHLEAGPIDDRGDLLHREGGLETEIGEEPFPLRRIGMRHRLLEQLEVLVGDRFPSEQAIADHLPPLIDQDLRDLVAHRQDRVQGRHRFLEDHRDLAAADLGHPRAVPPEGTVVPDELRFASEPAVHSRFVLAPREEVDPAEPNGARGDPARRGRDQVHDRERGDGLPAPALADQAEDLALLDVEVDAVRGPDHPAGRQELRLQPLDGQQGGQSLTSGASGRGRRAGRRPGG